MKHTFLCYLSPSLFHLWRVKAVGENDENLPADNGNTEKPKG